MKIAVITRHAVSNYGSILQAIATQRVLESMGHTCQFIDYIRKDESIWEQEKSELRNKPNWNRNPLKRAAYLLLRQPPSIAAGLRFQAERKKYLNLTKNYTTQEELTDHKPTADIYMAGSDQLWGPVIDGSHDSVYCLSFTAERDKRVAYASSFGRSNLTESTLTNYRHWLERFAYVAVRERQTMHLLKKLGIPAEQVLDPTLLLTKEEWGQFAAKRKTKPYVLVYQIHNNPRLDEYAKKVAKKKGLPLLRVSTSLHQLNRCGRLCWLPDVRTFVSYIKSADCLITDSFHGTAFAMNLNVPFVEVLTENGTQSRNTDLLDMVGLSERILRDDHDVLLAEKTIDYSATNQILAQKREESFEILKAMLDV